MNIPSNKGGPHRRGEPTQRFVAPTSDREIIIHAGARTDPWKARVPLVSWVHVPDPEIAARWPVALENCHVPPSIAAKSTPLNVTRCPTIVVVKVTVPACPPTEHGSHLAGPVPWAIPVDVCRTYPRNSIPKLKQAVFGNTGTQVPG
jgi:hypothetical protein